MAIMETLALVAAVFNAMPPGTTTKIAKSLKQSKDKVAGRLERSFATHLTSTLEKCGNVQTIFTENKKVPLRSIYTNLYISGDKRFRDEDILPSIDNIGNIVISGTGGAGKTMLMKFLALTAIEYPTGRIPLFIELRNLPIHSTAHFNQTIFDYCNDFHEGDQYAVFREGLRNGLFLIFFDGLDEVPSAQRDQVFNSIKRMAREFPKCKIIASSRPEIDTRNWGELTTYNVLGMTINQAKNLIEKIEFPEQLKSEFLDLMDSNFFKKHNSFLSVPLLCSLMLLTYHEYQAVPSRITVFYDQAFETLMRRHDRSKEGFFKRQLECGISSDRFRLVFSAFCYRTLAKQEISFTDQEFRHHLARAAAATEIEVDVDCLAADLVSYICVIMRDGLNLHFIHRSFQEYFSAVYLLRYRGGEALPLYDRLFEALNVNDVAIMAYDMDALAFEREWALPACKRIKDGLDSVEEDERPLWLLKRAWYSLRLDQDDETFMSFSWVGGGMVHETLTHLSKVYSSTFPDLKILFTGKVEKGISLRKLVESCVGQGNLQDIDKMGGEDDEDDGSMEICIADEKVDWIRQTSMHERLNACVNAIYELQAMLEARVLKREMIDLLS